MEIEITGQQETFINHDVDTNIMKANLQKMSKQRSKKNHNASVVEDGMDVVVSDDKVENDIASHNIGIDKLAIVESCNHVTVENEVEMNNDDSNRNSVLKHKGNSSPAKEISGNISNVTLQLSNKSSKKNTNTRGVRKNPPRNASKINKSIANSQCQINEEEEHDNLNLKNLSTCEGTNCSNAAGNTSTPQIGKFCISLTFFLIKRNP